MPGVNTNWRDVAEAVVKVYTTRTNGSFMQKKGSSIVWNHQHADPEFGAMQAREPQYHLQGCPQPSRWRCAWARATS